MLERYEGKLSRTVLRREGGSNLFFLFGGLKGFEDAIKASFPKAEIQKCVVHQIRNSTKFVSYKDRKAFYADMRDIYTAANEKAGLAPL